MTDRGLVLTELNGSVAMLRFIGEMVATFIEKFILNDKRFIYYDEQYVDLELIKASIELFRRRLENKT